MEFLSPEWFSPTVLIGFSWESEFFLYALALVPALLVLKNYLAGKIGMKMDFAFSEAHLFKDPTLILRFLPPVLFFLFLSCVMIALARPQLTNEKINRWSEGIDIMLVLDISESMLIQDFKPNRLEAAKTDAVNFINGRFQDRIGLVVFSGDAFSLSPLTTDYKLLTELITQIRYDMIERSGTAIGSALAVGTNRLRESKAKSKVIILLSDGENTAGNIDPQTAAELAASFDVKVYTIGVGRDGKVPFTDYYGRTQYVDNSLDESNLRKIAEVGSGQYFRASDDNALDAVFKKIDELERTQINEERYKDTKDFYDIYLIWALIFFLLWLTLKNTFVSNALMD
jgi:Ca-activated chloride channel family protein